MTYPEDKIIQDYLSKAMFIKDICKKYNISDYIFNKILKRNKIEKYDPHFMYPQNQVKFRVKEDFFEKETSEMAYVLGFIAAGGTVRKKTNEIKITVAKKDAELLEKFKKLIGGRDIKFYQTANGYDCATWFFTSKKIKDKLAEYNIVPNKTFSFVFPKNLKKEYWVDFIRGYFDGDGSISTAGSNAIRWQLCSATEDVLEVIRTFFEEEYGIPKVSILTTQKKHPLYYMQYSSTSTRKIYNVLYYKNCLCLERKRKKFEELL